MHNRAETIYLDAWSEGWRPDPDITVSEWADEFRMLPRKASAEPGRWRTSRTPYLREIMDCLSPQNRVERVVFMKGAQIGGTEIGFNWLGFIIHHCPGPALMVQPTVEIAKRVSKQRLAPSIEETPVLRERVAEARSRDSGNTMFVKEFHGGLLILTGANSAVGLRSMPIRYLFMDEVDGYPGDVDGEGDPVSLAEKRTDTFSRKKIFMVSTPKIKGFSRIESEYLSTDQRRYFVPCPHCGNYDWIRWPNIQWEEGLPDTARLLCESCGSLIEERHKTWMLERGQWKATAERNGRTAGFHLSSLYSPLGWRSWAAIAHEFLASKDDPAKLKTWVNTVLGETWQERGEAPEWQRVADLKEPYRSGDIPEGVIIITAGVDVQKNRLYYAVRGWGAASESWLIEHGELYGDTDQPDVWNQLSLVLQGGYGDFVIAKMLIDTGYRADAAYEFCRRHPGRAIPVKGHDRQEKPLKSATIDITVRGKTIKNGLQLWHVDTDYFKSWAHGRLNWDLTQPGAWHLPEDATDDYCRQLVNESVIVSPNGKRTWKEHGANHYLDCEMLNAGAAYMLQVHRLRPKGAQDQPIPGRRIISKGIEV